MLVVVVIMTTHFFFHKINRCTFQSKDLIWD